MNSPAAVQLAARPSGKVYVTHPLGYLPPAPVVFTPLSRISFTAFVANSCGIGLHRSCDQIDLIGVRGIESLALGRDPATGDGKRVQTAAAAIYGPAGGERGTTGIDEASAIHQDPVWVGHDHFAARTRNFQISAQLTRQCARYLVDDDPGRAPGEQIGIAGDVPRLLGASNGWSVIENDARLRHVELRVGVRRYSGGRRSRDIDLLQSIGCLVNCGPVCPRVGVRHHLRPASCRHAQCHPDRHYQDRQHKARGVRRAGRQRGLDTAVAPFALARGRFRDRHERATVPVENNSMATAVHILGQVQGADWRAL